MQCSLNHYHISCPNKFELAKWYQEKLGFEIIYDVEALGEQDGPLTISADGGKTGISIFTNQKKDRDFKLSCIPSFSVSPSDFVSFYISEKLESQNSFVYDHRVSYSLYFFDPMGTKLELVCYELAELEVLMKKSNIVAKRMNPSDDPAYTKRKLD